MSNTLAVANVTAECLRIEKEEKAKREEMINLNLPMSNPQ